MLLYPLLLLCSIVYFFPSINFLCKVDAVEEVWHSVWSSHVNCSKHMLLGNWIRNKGCTPFILLYCVCVCVCVCVHACTHMYHVKKVFSIKFLCLIGICRFCYVPLFIWWTFFKKIVKLVWASHKEEVYCTSMEQNWILPVTFDGSS